MTGYLKVGRLLPGENGDIRIMKDGSGEIGAVSRADEILSSVGMYIEEQGIPGKGAMFVIRVPSPFFRITIHEKSIELSTDLHVQNSALVKSK